MQASMQDSMLLVHQAHMLLRGHDAAGAGSFRFCAMMGRADANGMEGLALD